MLVSMEGGMSIDMGLNTASSSSEWQEVSQEDLVRVSESMKQAANMWQQIRWDAQKNGQIAKFLEFLFGEVKNDAIWEVVVELCSKPDHTWYGVVLAINELIILFAPFFPSQFEHSWLHTVFQHEIPHVQPMTIDWYIAYIRTIRQYYPLIQQMDAMTLSSLILALIEYFGYGRVDAEKKQEVLQAIQNKLA